MLNSENGLLNRRRFIALVTAATASFSGCSEFDNQTTTDTTDNRSSKSKINPTIDTSGDEVPLYRVFEKEVMNDKSYSNKFTDVTLETAFVSPSGEEYNYWGFFDGNGDGTGDRTAGNIWKFRFMPDETGTWSYRWFFSDGSKSGSGSFDCVESDAGPGVIQPYENNPHWFAYNRNPLTSFGGSDPVFLKSYYVHAHASVLQNLDWMAPNVYDVLIDAGYNHFQISGLLPVSHINNNQVFEEGPKPINKLLYSKSGEPTTMNFDVWAEMERHVEYLNKNNVAVQFFQGFDGKASSGNKMRWKDMNPSEKEWFVKYVMARMAPYANIAGYNYTYEEDGPEGSNPYELATLLEKYDPWNHSRTYHDQHYDNGNYFDLSSYTFGAIENHGPDDSQAPKSHHRATLYGYENKPVLMMEGNGLWASFWEASEEEVIDNIWAVTTAGGSFCWNDLCGSAPHSVDDLFSYTAAVNAIDHLNKVMKEHLTWYRMAPRDDLLSNEGGGDYGTYALAQPGKQYLVVEYDGGSFDLKLEPGTYNGFWMNTHTGNRVSISKFSTNGGNRTFSTPSTKDYVLVLTAVLNRGKER